MREPCRHLEELLNRDDIEQGELLDRLARLTGVEGCIADGLRRAADAGDWAAFERYSWAAFQHPAPEMAPILRAALRRHDPAVPNEDVVELLMALPDPESIPVLEDALRWNPEWDEFGALAVKCVWALAEIDDPRVAEILVAARDTGPEAVRDAAGSALATLS